MRKLIIMLIMGMCMFQTIHSPPAFCSQVKSFTLVPVYKVKKEGIASFYHYKTNRKLASGERYSTKENTAAHKTLPFNTLVEVKRLDTNTTVVVRINDRGPYIKGRIIDLNLTAAKELGIAKKKGIVECEIKILGEKKSS